MKRFKMFLFGFAMMCVLSGCSNSEAVEEEIEYPAIDYYGTYNENDLLIIGTETKLAGITTEIPQIDGLKDEEVQNKINEDMKSRIFEVCEDIPSLNYLDYYTDSNFANIISISVFYGSDDTYGQVYLNYNLINGEKLTFEELFYEDTDTLEIVRNAFYEALILSQMTGDISENEYYKIVKSFTETEDKQFVFTPAKIYMYQNEHTASVKMLDIADEISIYSRYLTEESIYEKDNIGKKNIMTGVSIPEEAFDKMEFGYLCENCWYDLTIMKEYIGDTFPEENQAQYLIFKKDRYDEFYEQIHQYKEIALEHPDKFYLVLSKPSFYLENTSEWNGEEWIEEYSEYAVVNEHFTVFEMPLELYETVYKEKILEAYRYDYLAMAGGIYIEATEENILVDDQYGEKRYNYVTGEEIN